MTIAEVWGKLKALGGRPEFFMVFLIFLVGAGSFGLGRLSALEREVRVPIRIEEVKGWGAASVSTAAQESGPAFPGPSGVSEGGVVGSKSGTKYHFPWCSGAQRIKEENKVYFDSIEQARAAGYSPAANCKGLE